ncbi:RCC1 and BTB domain-containing protein 1 [Dermatophagoides pteronyssinus]|uniref:RCC1 and BTB domain-containing protein 1 n=1 Tax=Dermatophagoides pteronyssinus TaxID=6956 RepID=A0ABQ8JQD3_DERPT|nr:RCC1 and BTB domain-containing protein 1 [Dermatophagoides pteronyssinus]
MMYDPENRTYDLGLWPILRRLSHEQLVNIHRFFVFNYGRSIIWIDRSGTVFAFGINESYKLGVFGSGFLFSKNKEYVEVDIEKYPMELCLLNGMDFRLEEGGKHMVALNSSGQLFTWGSNNLGQLGTGNITECEHINYIIDKIVDISCGYGHTIALTTEGKILYWGSITEDHIHANPIRFSKLENKKIVDIASHRYGSLFRSCDDEFFAIGKINGVMHDFIKLEIGSSAVKIKQIIGVSSHFFSLSDDGIIHKWMKISNSKNESRISLEPLGKMRKKISNNGHRELEENGPKINQIFVARNYEKYDEFIAVSDNGYCIWRGLSIWLTSISDVCSLYINSQTIDMTVLSSFVISPSYLISLNNFNDYTIDNDDSVSFIRLKIQDRILFIHRSFLMERSNYFRRMFITNEEPIKNGDTITIETGFSFPVYYYYLRYLYTDTLFVERDLQGKLYELAVKNGENDLKIKLARHYHDDEHNNTYLNFYTISK